MDYLKIVWRSYTFIAKYIICLVWVGASVLSSEAASDYRDSADVNTVFPVPQGYSAVPEESWGTVSSSLGGMLALYLPDSDYAQVLAGKIRPVKSFSISLSQFMEGKKHFSNSDFVRLRHLMQSGFFSEQNERLLNSRYQNAAVGTAGVLFSSLYNQPENTVGYYSVEPDFVAGSNNEKMIRVVYEVLLKDVLYEVEFSDRRGELEQSCKEADEYIRAFAGKPSQSEAGNWLNITPDPQLLVSTDYPGLSGVDFTVEYPGGWEVAAADSEKKLVALRPRNYTGDFDSGLTLSVLQLPFAVAELSATELEDIVVMTFRDLKQSAATYEKRELEINGMRTVIQRFLLTDSGIPGVSNWRQVYSIFSGSSMLNFTADLYYAPDTVSALVAAQEETLATLQEKIVRSMKLKK